MLITNEEAIDQAMRLDRTIGWVKATDDEGIAWRRRLVDGLLNACNAHGVAPKPVIDRCLELSKHCPTDFDLHTVAGIIREDLRSEEKAPPNFECCNKCNGTGWVRVFALHTPEGTGRSSYVRKEWISEEAYRAFNKALLGPENRQEVYSGVIRCNHGGTA